MMDRIVKAIHEGFFRNPLAWLLLAAFAIAEYGNYQRGKELDRVCELTGPHDVWVKSPKTSREEIDKICGARESSD
jgi:hypothetical protein